MDKKLTNIQERIEEVVEELKQERIPDEILIDQLEQTINVIEETKQ